MNTGRIFMRLKPRERAADRGRDRRRTCGGSSPAFPGMHVYPQVLPTIRIGGNLTKSQYQFTLQDADLAELYQLGADLSSEDARAARLPRRDCDLQITSPQVLVEIDREKAAALGVTAQQIETALYNAYGSPQVSTIYTPTNQY